MNELQIEVAAARVFLLTRTCKVIIQRYAYKQIATILHVQLLMTKNIVLCAGFIKNVLCAWVEKSAAVQTCLLCALIWNEWQTLNVGQLNIFTIVWLFWLNRLLLLSFVCIHYMFAGHVILLMVRECVFYCQESAIIITFT